MAAGLNGSSQALSIASTSAFAFSGDLTVAALVSLSGLNANTSASYVSDFRASGQTNNFTLGVINISGSGKMYGFGGGVDATGSTTLALNTTHSLVWRRSGTGVRYFANGLDNGGFTTSYSQSSSPCVIGARYTQAVEFVNGSIAEFAIWNAALSDSEIVALSRGFTPDQIRPQSIQFYAPLVRSFVDMRGGLTITNNNDATVATHLRIIT